MGGGTTRKNYRFKVVTCFNCQKKGHIASTCKNSKSVEASKSNKPNPNAMLSGKLIIYL